MNKRSRTFWAVLAVALLAGIGFAYSLMPVAYVLMNLVRAEWSLGDDTYTVEIKDYRPPTDADELLADDRLEDKSPAFDPGLVDRRPLDGWSLNQSGAVIRLDVPIVRPDAEADLLVLHPSYAAAAGHAKRPVLASVNLIDGKAKQFDDGLYAALDLAYYVGRGEAMKSHVQLLERIRARVPRGSGADDYLAAGLSLAGRKDPLSKAAQAAVDRFLAHQILSKPIAFYTWDPRLSECFRVLRYFAQPIGDPAVVREVARVLGDDPTLLADYRKVLAFYARLTDPLVGLSPADLIGKAGFDGQEPVALLPPSTSREAELFEKLFPRGLPADADLMRELIAAIRSRKVDLKPTKESGWYDYQAYALETLLLPETGPESSKLLLTKAYKKRMLEAFQALITKRKETHSRQAKTAETAAAPPMPTTIAPRLRLEPCPTYYLRTARSYDFLRNALDAAIGADTLASLHGLREGGERAPALRTELIAMRDLFYGFYLLSSEDIGLKPGFVDGEDVDRAACEASAAKWLGRWQSDPDLAADTRVGVPVYSNPAARTSRVWMTLGVRLTRLDARYVTPPKIRPVDGAGEWQAVEPHLLADSDYLIPVDEFAEVEVPGGRVLDRNELRAVCDRYRTKAAIVEAIRH